MWVLQRLPTDHIEKLLEGTCPNHAYPVKHKLRVCGMMNCMASGSLARGMEVNEVPDESVTISFPGEDTIMMIYDGYPLLGTLHVSTLGQGIPAHCGWEHRDAGM
jgi:hypothetical protein